MKATSVVLLAISAFASVNAQGKCNADNCARAVTGTSSPKGSPNQSSRLVDCGKAQTITTTPETSTSTSVVTTTTTVAAALTERRRGERVKARSTFTTSATTTSSSVQILPAYAAACSNLSRYSSACSCAGSTRATVTAPAPVTTTTSTSTVTVVSTTSSSAQSAPTCYNGIFTTDCNTVIDFCNPETGCLCVGTVEGETACVVNAAGCGGACSSSSECDPGSVCSNTQCCGNGAGSCVRVCSPEDSLPPSTPA